MALPTPLTTIFSPSASCLSEIHWNTEQPWFYLEPGTQCLPPGPNPASSSYYSPGLFCPQGYTVACSSEVAIGSVVETRATCCPQPDGLQTLSISPFLCKTTDLNTWYSSYGCTLELGDLALAAPLTVIATNISTFQTSFTVGTWEGVNAFSVQIRWQASDTITNQATLTTPTPAVSASASTPSATSAVATSTSSPTPSSDKGGGLSTTAKIAIGVVVPIVVIPAVLIILILIRRRRRNRKNMEAATGNTVQLQHSGAHSFQHMMRPDPSELDGTQRFETDSGHPHKESRATTHQ